MLRVLHLGKYYPPDPGGMETHLRDLAVRQISHAHVSAIVASNSLCSFTDSVEGVHVLRVPRYGTIASMPVCPGLIKAIRKCPAEVVHLHTPNPGAAAAFLLSGHKGKLVITHHSDILGRPFLRGLVRPVVRATMLRASAIIVTSQSYLDSSNELRSYREKCRVIPLGIDFCLSTTAPKTLLSRQTNPVILAVGRLVPYKGFDILIRAMKDIDAKLLLIGEGPEKRTLERLVQRQGLQEKVVFTGRVDSLVPHLEAASIFVLPSISRAEAFGLVQLEAMAAGLPVVNTRLDSGVPEVSIDGETGLTVAPGDPEAIARSVNFLLQNPERRIEFGAAARERVRSHFTADLMAAKTWELYESIL